MGKAFFIFKAGDLIDGKDNAYTNLAQSQMDYILGKNGQRYYFLKIHNKLY